MQALILPVILSILLVQTAIGSIKEESDWAKIGENVHPGVVNIQIKPEFAPLMINMDNGLPLTGRADFDAVSTIFGVTKIEKAFVMESTPKDPAVPDLSRYYTIYFPDAFDPYTVGSEYERCAEVVFAEHVRIHRYFYEPNDARYRSQWHLRQCGFPAAWDETHGSRDIVIGIVDSGMDMPYDDNGDPQIHEDIVGNIWVNPGEDLDHDGAITLDDWDGEDNDRNGYADDFHGWNITENSNWPDDAWAPRGGDGHGTHVAGLASATTDNEIGVAGAAFSASLMIVACYSPTTDGQIWQGYRGIEYCGRARADIVNLSWGGFYAGSRLERDAINFARNQGCILFAGAGNDDFNDRANNGQHFFPNAYEGVIGVGASDDNDNKAGFSNYGDFIDLVAPGTGMLSTIPHNRYSAYDGTSMASPFAAGLGGLILANNDMNEAALLSWMQRTAVDISDGNQDYPGIRYRIDADYAINATHPRYKLEGFSLHEVNGNGDGRADPNETCVIEITISNQEGYTGAVNATATLSNPDTTLVIQRAQVQLGNIAAGGEVFNGGDAGMQFRVQNWSKPHYSNFKVSITDESEHTQTMDIPLTIGRPLYLLVDDDEGANYDSLMHLDLMLRPVVHDVWRVADSGSPNLQTLSSYTNVVWETGNARNALTEADQNALASFLGSGMKGLVLSGQFLSEDIGATPFHQNYLHARHLADNVGERQLTGKQGHPISNGLALILQGGGGAGNSTSPSAIEPINGADTLFIYNNSRQVGGISYFGNGYSVVYLAFALEAVSGGGQTTRRSALLEKVFDRFHVLEAPAEDAPVSPASFSLATPYPNPFNAITSVQVDAVPNRPFTLQVLDISGRAIATLHEGRSSGSNYFIWNGDSSPAGIYLFKLSYDGGAVVRKAALVK